MTEASVVNIEDLIEEYVRLQTNLIGSLKHMYSDYLNWDTTEPLRKLEPGQQITVEHDDWEIMPHGLGCRFTRNSDGAVIDALELLETAPESFDPSRIESYLESIGVEEYKFENIKNTVSFNHLNSTFSYLVQTGYLCKLSNQYLYSISK